MRLLGTRLDPPNAQPGQTVQATAWFFLRKPVGPGWGIFVHTTVPSGELTLATDDHLPLGGLLTSAQWQVAQVLQDVRTVRVPDPSPGEQLEVFVGLYREGTPMPVDGRTGRNGHRVSAGVIRVGLGRQAQRYTAPLLLGSSTVDGRGNEPAWQNAPAASAFMTADGRSRAHSETAVKMLWDAEALYVLFECQDDDVWAAASERDGPVADGEVVGLLVAANGNARGYTEIQASPGNTVSDARFTARHEGRDPAFNTTQQVATVVDGTLNDPGAPDTGWTSEWRLPWKDLPGLPQGFARVGGGLRLNLFRLERIRRHGRVVHTEASAWSSPVSKDLHNMRRMGEAVLGP